MVPKANPLCCRAVADVVNLRSSGPESWSSRQFMWQDNLQCFARDDPSSLVHQRPGLPAAPHPQHGDLVMVMHHIQRPRPHHAATLSMHGPWGHGTSGVQGGLPPALSLVSVPTATQGAALLAGRPSCGRAHGAHRCHSPWGHRGRGDVEMLSVCVCVCMLPPITWLQSPS